ncbi:MAG: UDP-N-acetylmuramoyl-L-alanine--D-glutamate ligase [Desulfamplus sp.]|nr:UDP-N-acetylmuramoyl-L-alanine--D-glutamate ligase [Desulfamplus sp.]
MITPIKKYILVVGLGKSGTSAAKFFKKQGHQVIVTDINPAKKEAAKELEDTGIQTEIGFHKISTFENADMIVVSPGIPLDGEHFQRAIKKGVTIRGEMDIASEHIKKPLVAITGTNGKTTVTTLISQMLSCSGLKVFTGGNIGTPLIEYLNHTNTSKESHKLYDVVVAEVSSFQLDTAQNFAPDVAVLLNITEDHLNRYPDFKAYEDSKWSIFSGQNEKAHAIINSRIDLAESRIANIKSQVTLFNTDHNMFAAQKRISRLRGKHNQENIEASILAALSAGASMDGIESALKTFNGLPHRIEYVATINGVEFYNDSKGTNTDAVARAIESFDQNTILIMGGQDKNMDFSVLKKWIRGRVKKVVLMGEAKEKINTAISECCDTIYSEDMEQAVNTAFNNAKPGDTILLSPGCASFDRYGSYTERGDDFIRQVKRLN